MQITSCVRRSICKDIPDSAATTALARPKPIVGFILTFQPILRAAQKPTNSLRPFPESPETAPRWVHDF